MVAGSASSQKRLSVNASSMLVSSRSPAMSAPGRTVPRTAVLCGAAWMVACTVGWAVGWTVGWGVVCAAGMARKRLELLMPNVTSATTSNALNFRKVDERLMIRSRQARLLRAMGGAPLLSFWQLCLARPSSKRVAADSAQKLINFGE